MKSTEQGTIIIGGKEITYIFTRKRVKNINIRISDDGIIKVSAPYKTDSEYIRELLIKKSDFIIGSLEKLQNINRPQRLFGSEELILFGKKLTVQPYESDTICYEIADDFFRLGTGGLPCEEALEKCLNSICTELYDRINRETAELFCRNGFEVECLPVTIKDMKSRWGSCSVTKRRLTMNSRLLAYPEECIRAVFCHEYAHIFHADHSKAFYRLVFTIIPEYKQIHAKLRMQPDFCPPTE